MEQNKTIQALVYLMYCAIQGKKAEPIPELDYEALYDMSCSHSVGAMVAIALENGGLLEEEYVTLECRKKWMDVKIKALRKNILLDAEREKILQKLEEDGVWYLPLKGSILKEMYPDMGMRQMADNDILFDEAYREELKEYMKQKGYRVEEYGKGNHDVYAKEPIYNFEFHVALFGMHADVKWLEYYKNVKQRLVKDEDKEYGYHFTDEDFYVYVLLHGYKHYSGGGTGIRFLSDIFVFLRTKKETLDWNYIAGEVKKLEIEEFEEKIRTLAEKVFEDGKTECLNGDEQECLRYLIGAGTYGTLENVISHDLDKLQGDGSAVSLKTKMRYVMKRIFPDYEFMKWYSPICEKHPWTMPFFWVVRWVRAVTVRRKAVFSEVKTIKKKK